MGDVRQFLRAQKGKWLHTTAVFCFAPLLPEYCVPILCVPAYCRTLRRGFPLQATEKAIVVYILWMLLGVLWSGAKATATSILFLWIFFFLAGRMLLCTVKTAVQLDALCFGGALSGGVSGAIGIGQMLLYHFGDRIAKPLKTMFNPFWHPLDGAVAKLFFRILPEQFQPLMQRKAFIAIPTRASGTFTNPIFYAVFLCMMLPLCAYCLFYFHDRKRRAVSLVCLGMCAGGIALSYARGPYLALAVIFVVLLFYGARSARKLLAMGGGFLVLLLLFGNGVYRRLLSLLRTDDVSVNTRARIWDACLRMLRGHWLFGYGTGVGNVRQMLHETYHIRQPHAHNLFLEILLENGAIGLALFLVILALFLRQTVRLWRQGGRARGVGVSLFASVAGFCACGMADYPFYGIKPICIFLMLLAMAECAVRVFSDTRTDKTAASEPSEEKETAAV